METEIERGDSETMTKLIPEAADAIARALKPEKPTVIELMEDNARLKEALEKGREAWLREAGQADFHRDNCADKDMQIATLTARVKVLEEALSAAIGYMTNAAIDLSTGAPKRTAMATINGGIERARRALGEAK